MKLPFGLAVLGLVLSAVDHVSTFFGIDLHGPFPLVLWGLHLLGMFLGALLVFSLLVLSNDSPRRMTLSELMRYVPRWMKAITVLLVMYGAFTFCAIFVLSEAGTAAIKNGNEVLVSHGTVIRRLSPEEYERIRVYPTRLFSGAWMSAFAVFVAVFYSRYIDSDVDPRQ